MNTLKITNPLYVGQLGPQIARYAEKINIPTMNYESVYTYFMQIIQHGGQQAEFWVAFNDEKPVAFASWSVAPLPYIATVMMNHIYKWVPEKEPLMLLLKEFSKFRVRNRGRFSGGFCLNEKVAEVFTERADEMGYEVTKTPQTYVFIKKKED